MADQKESSPKEDPGSTEKRLFTPGTEHMVFTSDDVIEEISKNRTWKFNVYVIWLMLIWIRSPSIIYLTSFTGLDPDTSVNGDTWSCVTEVCHELVKTWNKTELHKIPCSTKETEDGYVEFLLQNSDYKWNLTKTSFSVDFGLFCEGGSRKGAKTLISSIYFAGALAALMTGSYIFDNIGRKKSAIIGTVITLLITFSGTFCHDYYFLLAIRFLQGYSGFLVSTPMFILVQELLPARLRNYSNCIFMIFWALGYAIVTCIGYLISDWNYMFLASTMVCLVFSLPVFFCIESPRYFLMNNDIDAAKESLKFLASLNNMDLDINNIVLTDKEKTKERKQSYLQQVKDMISYPTLTIETGLQMFLWFITAMAYYGFNFGWGYIFSDLYIGYLMAMVGELIAYIGLTPLIAWIGRRRSMILMYVGAACSYLLAIPDVDLDNQGSWTLESVACLAGAVFVSAAFSGVYLWSGELAPTSHRGFVFGAASSAARIGSFLGPFIFLNLKPIVAKAVPLVGMAVLAVLCCVASFLLVETGDKKIALTALLGKMLWTEGRQDTNIRFKMNTSVFLIDY